MPGGQKVVQVPGVGNIAFPATMADADINAAISHHLSGADQPGAFQRKPGGPVMNASGLATGADADNGPSFSGLVRDAALKAGETMVPNAGTDAGQNLRNIGTGLNEQVNTAATTPWGQGGPLWGVLSMLAKGLMGGVHGAASGIEQMGSGAINRDPQKVAEGGGSALGNLFQVGAFGKAPEVAGARSEVLDTASSLAGKVPEAIEGVTPAIQKFAGVGPEFTKASVKKWQEETAAADAAHQDKIAKLNEKHQVKVAEVEASNQQAKEAALQKQQLSDEVSGHAKELSERLPKLKEQERAFAKSMYPEIDGTADSGDVYSKMSDAVDSNLRGTGRVPTALKKVIDDLAPEDVKRSTGPQVGGRHLDLSNPDDLRAFQRFKKAGVFAPDEVERMEGQSAKGSLDFETLHGYYSELGEALGKDMPGDERSALMQGRSALAETMRKMAEADKKLGPFQDAQKNWGKYENTFNKTWNDGKGMASPIAKALNAKDPVSGQILPEKLQQILGNDKGYKLAQQMLGRYKGGPTDVLQLMKEKADQASTLPKKLKQGEMPTAPNLPTKEAIPAPDVQAQKAEVLGNKAQMLGGFSGRGMFIDTASLLHFLTTGNPIALSVPVGRRLVAKALRSESLTKLTPEESAMLKPSQVYPTAKAAAKATQKNGYKMSEKAATMSAAPKDLGPEFKAGEQEHEIQRNKAIIRNPRATPEEIAIAKARLKEAQ